jgi:hypothetical protein
MKTQKNSFSDSYKYEAFMKRAHRSSRDRNRGIDNSVFLLLDHIKKGYHGNPSDYAKQITKIKDYLSKAVDSVLKWDLSAKELQEVKYYKIQIQQARDEGSLADAIDGLLDTTQRFNN